MHLVIEYKKAQSMYSNLKVSYLLLRAYSMSVFVLLRVLQPSPCFAEEISNTAQDYQLSTDIADAYIKSFPSEGKEDRVTAVTTTPKQAAHHVRPPKLLEKAKREVVFNHLFKKSSRYALLQREMVPCLNEYAWKDLHLFYGTTGEPAYHLLGRINRTITTLGEGALATMLATPTSNIEKLRKRQHIIQAFLEKKATVERLKVSLRRYQDAEQSVLSLYTSADPLYSAEYKQYMDKYFYAKNNDKVNKNAERLELKKRFFRDFWGIQYNFLWPVTLPLFQETFYRATMRESMQGPGSITLSKFLWVGAIPYYGGWYKWNKAKSIAPKGSNSFGLTCILLEGYYTWTAYKGISNYLEYSAVLRNLALRMADVQAFIVTATEVSECIAAAPTLEALYGAQLTNIRSLLARGQENTELGRLIHYLQTLPFNHWSYFLDHAGRLLASHKLFTEYQDTFSDAMYELGELDAFISIATLMQEVKSDSHNNAYIFTKFLDRDQQSKPYIKLEDMWNPFLDAKVAVSNSIVMDAAGGLRNVILTGPNAGGKSTFLTGVADSVLLSQTFGIAPAKVAVLTPFNKINTSIYTTDDIAAGKSLFMAEVDRAKKHVDVLSKLRQDEFSFSIFDEPFSGTNPTEGAAAEYSVLESMAEYANALNIVATHYPVVMLLEKNRPDLGFANYKVYITYQGQGSEKKIDYTYKVIPGKSNQAIAIDILEEQGYDIRLLKRAREIITHPERYSSQF
ncbi:MAG: MutS-related protein [Bacteroidota bacterium]